MQWTPEADLLLVKYLLQIHKITPDYKRLAEAMGNGVTPKAVTHRISKLRGLPASAAGCGENGSPTKVKKVKGAAAPMTPKGGKKRAAQKHEDEDEDDGLEEESPRSAKKVKVED